MSQENVEIFHRFFDAYDRRDRDAVAACLHPEVEWHTIAGPLFGVDALYGRAEMLAFMFEQIPEELPDFRAMLEEVTLLGKDQALTVANYVGHGVGSGARVEMRTAALSRFSGGMIAWFREFPTRAEALDAAGLRE